MTQLHRWAHCLSLKSKWQPRYTVIEGFRCLERLSLVEKSPWITWRLGKCINKVGIHSLLYLNLAFFYELCNFPQIVQSDAIWSQLCEIIPSCNIRWPEHSFVLTFCATNIIYVNCNWIIKIKECTARQNRKRVNYDQSLLDDHHHGFELCRSADRHSYFVYPSQ